MFYVDQAVGQFWKLALATAVTWRHVERYL